MSVIKHVWAREILDSRATPAVEAAVQLDNGLICTSSSPSGASTGSYEALELRDQDPNRYHGKGVLKAVESVNSVLGPSLVGMDPTHQEEIDRKMISVDGTPNKSKYGANSILAVSEAVAKAGAQMSGKATYLWIMDYSKSKGLKIDNLHIPTPIFNMINGGLHGAGNLDFQEFHVIPASSKSYSDGLRGCVEIYTAIGQNLARRGAIHSVGDEGGYAPNLFTNADALEVLVESIRDTNKYSLGRDVFLGLDVAASIFYKDGEYVIRDKTSPMNDTELAEYYKNLNEQYKLALLEDPFAEDAWDSWKKLVNEVAGQVTIVGDDLLVTHPKRVERAVKEKACTGILIKPNQVGTVTETIEVIKMARDAGWKVIVSHRSGETNDFFIADFAVGVDADYVKFGAPARGERVAKYNRLSSIETELNMKR